MKQTFIQERIEYIVTNGSGYDSRTRFIECREKELGFIERNLVSEDSVKNSPEGLQAHLVNLDLKYWTPRVNYMQELLKTAPKGHTFRFANGMEARLNFFQRIVHRVKGACRLYLLKSNFDTLRELAVYNEAKRIIKSRDFANTPLMERFSSGILSLSKIADSYKNG